MTMLLLLLTILPATLISGSINLSSFQQEALDQHNAYRALHCTGPMMLNSTLNDIAQNYSEYLAVNQIFAHSGYSGLGECLYSISRTVVFTYLNGTQPVTSWYSEVSRYDYNNPGYSTGTAHFTQIVWVNSVQMGIGISFTNDSKKAYVVANYYPAGNVQGGYTTNVLPLCGPTSGSTSGGTTSSAAGSTTIMTRPQGILSVFEYQWNIYLTTFALIMGLVF